MQYSTYSSDQISLIFSSFPRGSYLETQGIEDGDKGPSSTLSTNLRALSIRTSQRLEKEKDLQ